jgi:beta-1,4-mannosyltransferase
VSLSFLHFRTPDEDFDVLLQAAIMYDLRASTLMGETAGEGEPSIPSTAPGSRSYPRLLFIVTGE